MSNTKEALRVAGGLIVNRLAQNLDEDNSNASGDLDESITFRLFNQGSTVGVKILMNDYWEFVDKGRKPGKRPPIDKIKGWLTYPNVKSKLGHSDKFSVTDIAQVNSLAYSIAKKIGDKGTKGNDFATDVFESDLVQKDLANTLLEAVIADTDLFLEDFISSFD